MSIAPPHLQQPQPTSPSNSNVFSSIVNTLFSPSKWTYRSLYGDENWSVMKPYVIGCGSAMYMQFFFMPFLNLKTYSQLVPQAEYSRGRLLCLSRYFRAFGLCNLWRGFPAAFQGLFLANSAHLYYLYNSQHQPSTLSYEKALTTSVIAVSLATLFYAPFDLIVTRQQADVLLPTQYQYNYRSIYSAIPSIISKESPMTLFRGLQYSLPKNLLMTIGLSASFISSQHHNFSSLSQPSSPTSSSSQLLDTLRYLGCAIAVNSFLHPLDTLKTITQASPTQFHRDNNITISPVRFHLTQHSFSTATLHQPSPVTLPGAQINQFGAQNYTPPHNTPNFTNMAPSIANSATQLVKKKMKLSLLWRGTAPQVFISTAAPITTYVIVDFLSRSRLLK